MSRAMTLRSMLHLLFVFAFCLVTMVQTDAEEHLAYVGTYTDGDSEGIYLLGFNSDTGEIEVKGVAAKTENPSFVAFHPNGRYLYAVNETNSGELSSFRIDPKSHQLEFINERPSGGAHPCHLVLDDSGQNLLVANYTGGNVSVTRVNVDGSLGSQTTLIQHKGSSVDPRQQEPHAHSINLDAKNKFAVAADLGTDQLLVYSFASELGKLTAHSSINLKPGSGPRHFSFHPDGKHAYAINELLSTVCVLEYDPQAGKFRQLQTITTLPRDFDGKSFTAEVRVSADGKFVYGSNRGHDSVAVFRINDDHSLTLVQIEPIGGKTPRNFTFDPTGRFLLAAGQSTNSINVFSIDPKLGKLTKTPHSVSVPKPVCIRFAK